MRWLAFLVMASPVLAQIAAAPMQSDTVQPTYPRLTRFPDAGVMARINAALAAQEKEDRATRKDCLNQLRQAKQKPTPESYSAAIRVAYLSARYLSIETHTGYDCGGPYPTNDASAPLTFDLKTGKALDWDSLFKPGFITAPDNGKAGLWALYQKQYARSSQGKDCKDVIAQEDNGSLYLWLDRGKGLVAQPDFPHVIEACADPLAFKAAELARFAKPELLNDLGAAR